MTAPTEHDRFDYLADRRPPAAALAERRPGRGVGHSQHRAFPVRPTVDVGHRGDDRAGSRRAQLFLARLRRARRHLAPDGRHGQARRERHRGAQFGCLQPSTRASSRPATSSAGSGWATAQQFDPDQQAVGGRGARADQAGGRYDREGQHRPEAARLAGPGAHGIAPYARYPCGERHRLRRRLGERRAALSDAGEDRGRCSRCRTRSRSTTSRPSSR